MKRAIDWLLSRSDASDCKPASLGLLVMRVSVGLMMAFGHGWGKLTGFAELSTKFPDPLGVGSTMSLGLTVFAEVFCSLALVVGLATRAAAIPLMITMLVAVLVIHADDPWGKQEFALLYFIPYLTLLLAGPGRYSLDRIMGRR